MYVCMCHSVPYNPVHYDKVFGRCVTDEYPRRYSKSYLEDAERSSNDNKSPEDPDVLDQANLMQFIGQFLMNHIGKDGRPSEINWVRGAKYTEIRSKNRHAQEPPDSVV